MIIDLQDAVPEKEHEVFYNAEEATQRAVENRNKRRKEADRILRESQERLRKKSIRLFEKV